MFSTYWWEQYRAEIIPAVGMFLIALVITRLLQALLPNTVPGVRIAIGFFVALFARKPIHNYMERFGFKFDPEYNRENKSVWRLAWVTAVIIAFVIYLITSVLIFQFTNTF